MPKCLLCMHDEPSAVGNKGLIIGFCVCGWKITFVLLQKKKKKTTKTPTKTTQCEHWAVLCVKTTGGNVTLCDPAQWGCMGLTLVGEDISAPMWQRSHSGSHTPNVCQDAQQVTETTEFL